MNQLSEMSEGGGNAKSPPLKQRKQRNFWKCNIHIPEGKNKPELFQETFERIERAFKPLWKEYVFGEEYGNSGDTPHLEGYMYFEKKTEFHIIQQLFKFSDLQPSNKARMKSGVKYCVKEGNRIFTNIKIPKPLVTVKYDMLRPDQQAIVELFKEDEDPIHGRNIYWFWESKGNWGKSFTCLHLIDYCGAIVVQGKNNDILCGVKDYFDKHGEVPRLIIFDIPRVNANHVSYQAIESVKGGAFYSGKYESGMARFNKPHICCFANEMPEIDNLSADRWRIVNLNNEFSTKMKLFMKNGGKTVKFKNEDL